MGRKGGRGRKSGRGHRRRHHGGYYPSISYYSSYPYGYGYGYYPYASPYYSPWGTYPTIVDVTTTTPSKGTVNYGTCRCDSKGKIIANNCNGTPTCTQGTDKCVCFNPTSQTSGCGYVQGAVCDP